MNHLVTITPVLPTDLQAAESDFKKTQLRSLLAKFNLTEMDPVDMAFYINAMGSEPSWAIKKAIGQFCTGRAEEKYHPNLAFAPNSAQLGAKIASLTQEKWRDYYRAEKKKRENESLNYSPANSRVNPARGANSKQHNDREIMLLCSVGFWQKLVKQKKMPIGCRWSVYGVYAPSSWSKKDVVQWNAQHMIVDEERATNYEWQKGSE